MRTALCALAALAALRPPPARARIGTIDVDDVHNNTVCPIMTVTDENPERTPRLIKMWKCAPDPLGICRVRNLPVAECCHGLYRDKYAFECVELYDFTRVAYETKELDIVRTRWAFQEVAVGCACVVRELHDVATLPSGPDRRSGLAASPYENTKAN